MAIHPIEVYLQCSNGLNLFLGLKSLNSPILRLKNGGNELRKCGIITPVVSAEWATDHDETRTRDNAFYGHLLYLLATLPLSYQFILDK